MRVPDILHLVSASVEWIVLFRLAALRRITNDDTIQQMLGLPGSVDLKESTHAVLTDRGPFVSTGKEIARISDNRMQRLTGLRCTPSVYERFANLLTFCPLNEVDCLGLGERAPYPPVLMWVRIREGEAEAKALFDQEPPQDGYELLTAVGVKFCGGYRKDSRYLAHFTNRLPIHISAGSFADFARTSHCTAFFLQHGVIDPKLKAGLIKASEERTNRSRHLCLESVVQFAEEACHAGGLSMTCHPPPPARLHCYGNLVPLGFLLNALDRTVLDSSADETRKELRRLVLSQQQRKLWAFHTDGLVTATDSALVLQGLHEPDSVQALERFADGAGGYYPQLWAHDKQPGRMLVDDRNQHWCQADFPTTCLISSLRGGAGLETNTESDYLASHFETRSGLFFANPYLVDWALALALEGVESAAELRRRLRLEILASMNDDHSFGVYDVPLSTALAGLSLAALGYRGPNLRLIQLRLAELMETDSLWCGATLFYSSLRRERPLITTADELRGLLRGHRELDGSSDPQIVKENGERYEVSFYVDTKGAIAAVLAVLALSEECRAAEAAPDPLVWKQGLSHPRYRCPNPLTYIANFALPPYVTEPPAFSPSR